MLGNSLTANLFGSANFEVISVRHFFVYNGNNELDEITPLTESCESCALFTVLGLHGEVVTSYDFVWAWVWTAFCPSLTVAFYGLYFPSKEATGWERGSPSLQSWPCHQLASCGTSRHIPIQLMFSDPIEASLEKQKVGHSLASRIPTSEFLNLAGWTFGTRLFCA